MSHDHRYGANAALVAYRPSDFAQDLDDTVPTNFADAFGPFAGSTPIDDRFAGICAEQPSERERREHFNNEARTADTAGPQTHTERTSA